MRQSFRIWIILLAVAVLAPAKAQAWWEVAWLVWRGGW